MEDVVVLPARPRRSAGPVAVVLSSGANMGAVQVGVLRALVEHGVHPDLVVGCSIGALNGAALAQDPTVGGVARLEAAWTTAGPRGVLPRQWLPAVALIRRTESMASRDGLHRLIERSVAATSFADLAVPFHCVATDVEACADAWFSEGPLVEALLASSAMPAVFPPVSIDGRCYIDGAVVDDVPVRRAVALGARTVYVVEVGPLSSRDWSASRRPLGAAIEAYWVARRHRFRRELEAVPPEVEVHLMPHGDPPRLRLNDFTLTPDLIAGAHAASCAYLDALRPLGTPA